MSANEIAVVNEIQASRASLTCPHCGAEIDGWLDDPRGREDTCDECNKPYRIAEDATVKIR